MPSHPACRRTRRLNAGAWPARFGEHAPRARTSYERRTGCPVSSAIRIEDLCAGNAVAGAQVFGSPMTLLDWLAVAPVLPVVVTWWLPWEQWVLEGRFRRRIAVPVTWGGRSD